MAEKKKSNFLLQGSILAMAGIISRIIGLVYRIPMLNIIGEDGMGVYNTAYNIYNIMLMISSYSLPMAVSKLIAASLGRGEQKNVKRIFGESLLFGTAIGFAAALVMFFGAEFFAGPVMKMPESALAIKALAPVVFFMGMLGVMRGFFQGHGNMVPTAVSQIFEQIIHVAVSLLAGYYLCRLGAAKDAAGSDFYASSYGAAGATVGTAAGALFALLMLSALYLRRRKAMTLELDGEISDRTDSRQETMRLIVLTALPILISATLSNLGQVIDQAVYAQYIGEDYRAVWGVYSAKYIMLVNVVIAISSALSSSIVPTISRTMAKGDTESAMKTAAGAIRFIMLLTVPASVGLGVLGKPCFDLLFRTTDNTLAGTMMLYGSLAATTFCLSNVTIGILQGCDHFWLPIKNCLLALLIHTPILAIFLWGFKSGIIGVVINHVIYSLIVFLLNLRSLGKLFHYRQELKKTLGVTAVCSLIMGACAFFLYKGFRLVSLGNTVSTVLSVGAAILVYAALLLKSGGLSEEELRGFPKGRLLVRAAKKLHLLRRTV